MPGGAMPPPRSTAAGRALPRHHAAHHAWRHAPAAWISSRGTLWAIIARGQSEPGRRTYELATGTGMPHGPCTPGTEGT